MSIDPYKVNKHLIINHIITSYSVLNNVQYI